MKSTSWSHLIINNQVIVFLIALSACIVINPYDVFVTELTMQQVLQSIPKSFN